MHASRCLSVAAVILSISVRFSGQGEVLRTWPGVYPFGSTELDSLPDADGDTFPEVLVGFSSYGPAGLSGAGRVFVLWSASPGLEPAFELVGTFSGQSLGESIASIGDVDGDGYDDFVASGFSGPMFVCSGTKGSVLFTGAFAAAGVGDLGDVNDDGLTDFVVGSPRAAKAFLYLGGSFSVMLEVSRPPEAFNYGKSVAVLGDVDGDAFPDFAVGAPGSGSPHDSNPGYVVAYSGAEGGLLYQLTGEPGSGFGGRIAAAGDLNGDGRQDLVVAAFSCCDGTPKDAGPGRIYFFDGRSGAGLGVIDPPPLSQSLGLYMHGAGDLDGNGHSDVLASVRPSILSDSVIRAIDGGTRRCLFEIPSVRAFSGGHNWNDDGFPDILYGGILDGSAGISVLSGAPPGVRALGRPCARAIGSEPRIGATGEPRIGTRYPLHLGDVAPDLTAFLLVGALEPVVRSFPGPSACSPLVDPLALFRVRTSAIGPGRGAATVELPIPNHPALIGASFLAQWVIRDPAGNSALTRALQITLSAP